jgi:hypothetical protein
MSFISSSALTVAAVVAFAAASPSTTVEASAAPVAAPASFPPPAVEGPVPGTAPGDPGSAVLSETYPFFSTYVDLAGNGYVEEEFYLAGLADGFAASGTPVGTDVPYRTRIVVRRPVDDADFNGTVLMEWQNVTAGYDLDALWSPAHVMRFGYAWVGVSAQRVGVNQLRGWSPTRYGSLDVTGGGAYVADELSYDIFAQAAAAVRSPAGVSPLGDLSVDQVLAIGASQSASRMRIYYDLVLPQVTPVFDGFSFIVGSAPTRVGPEPVFQVLSETDVRSPVGRRPDDDVFRRWEVAGAAHSGHAGQVYRAPLAERDLGGVTEYQCTNPPFSRVPLGHVVNASYDHLAAWVADGVAPPHAPYLEFAANGSKVRNELGLAQGGIQLSQVSVPTALNTGDNSGMSFCVLFGTHVPFDEDQLDGLYRNHGQYVSAVRAADRVTVGAGYIVAADAADNHQQAVHSPIGR